MIFKHLQIWFIGIFTFMVFMCVPPQGDSYADFVKEVCYFTKNGQIINEPMIDITGKFIPLPENLYPTIGLCSHGAAVKTNFGEEPLMFDVEGTRIPPPPP